MDDAQFRQWVREQESPKKPRKARATVTVERRPLHSTIWEPVFALPEKQAQQMLRQVKTDRRYVYRIRHDRIS